ncbi:MAG TPA: phosphate ABC transporter substrate-binding protein PstS family protein [Actinomycetota bacterium]|jgi:phosphate transport system substrate-binding protein|nr:phosphate ABC transporter substrate-binding protein PstS family protein [Actinomycetota bacterium]
MSKRGALLVAGLLSLALTATACGGGNASTDGEGGLTGDLFVSGSSTVEPISALVAELFSEENPDVAISVEGPGTGDGFELFCNGETDISDASRQIEEEEAEVCQQNGIEYTELEVGIDGITVMTSPENEAVGCLNFADLYALMGPESQGFANWSDANALGEELGGIGTPYPDGELVMVAPGEESGTYDSFLEIAFGDIAEEREQEEVSRPDYQASPNDNVIIEGIAGSPASLGWVGYSFYVNNQDVVKAVEIAEGTGSECVAPTAETIASGTYPLQRSLYIYVNKAKAAEKEALRAFVDLYVSETGLQTAVEQVGYIVLPADRISATQSTWESEQPA